MTIENFTLVANEELAKLRRAAEAWEAVEKHRMIVEPHWDSWTACQAKTRWDDDWQEAFGPAPIDAVLALKAKLECNK